MKKMTLTKSHSFFIMLFCAVNFGFGQSIFDNPITGTNPNTSNPYTIGQYVDTNITVSGIGRGIGLNGNTADDRYNARDWNLTILDANDYFYFTITPNSGYEIDFVSFVYTGQASGTGPTNFAFSSSLDTYASNIGSPTVGGTTINLSGAAYQNITTAITFRLYAWGGSNTNGTFSINDFTFNGTVTVIPCFVNTTWSAGVWDNGTPTINTNVVIADDYNTATDGSFSACSLTVNPTFTLTVANDDYVEVENDVVANGGILVNTRANFIQNNDTATFTDNSGGGVVVSKDKTSQRWYSYTYWGSPVENENIEIALGPAPSDRRFSFNALNFVDNNTEIGNTNTFTPGADGLDDNGDDWVNTPTGLMIPGIGYAATAGEFAPFFPITETFNFFGTFNNGEVKVPLISNSGGTYEDWNLVGNPYPCAISADQFFSVNAGVVDAIYLWDQGTPPSSANGGSQNSNFSADDYAIINAGTGETGARGDTGVPPNRFIPSGQGFFVDANVTTDLIFNNSMRSILNDNSQFFKNTKTKGKSNNSQANKLWVNLTSDNGVFNQILVGYVNGATNANDGTYYDTPRSLSSINSTSLYSVIESDNSKFAIQGKATNSLNKDEIIKLGFKSTITVPTLFKLSVAQLKGEFLTNNSIFLVDNLLNKVHDLSVCDYTFTSAVGEFNSRFEIAFTNKTLAVNDLLINTNALKIVELQDDFVQFNTSNNLSIKEVNIYDLFGRELYRFKGENTSEVYKLSNLKNTVYIAKVALSDGTVVTKKMVKK